MPADTNFQSNSQSGDSKEREEDETKSGTHKDSRATSRSPSFPPVHGRKLAGDPIDKESIRDLGSSRQGIRGDRIEAFHRGEEDGWIE